MSNMLKISEAASMGMHMMVLLAAEQDRLVSAKEAATLMAVSEAHLAKVLQRLARADLVNSVRGPKGGFSLARASELITLLEVYEAIEGPVEVRDCLFGTRLCDGRHCIFGHMLKSVDAQVREYLAGTKLADVVDTVQSVLQGARKSDGDA